MGHGAVGKVRSDDSAAISLDKAARAKNSASAGWAAGLRAGIQVV